MTLTCTGCVSAAGVEGFHAMLLLQCPLMYSVVPLTLQPILDIVRNPLRLYCRLIHLQRNRLQPFLQVYYRPTYHTKMKRTLSCRMIIELRLVRCVRWHAFILLVNNVHQTLPALLLLLYILLYCCGKSSHSPIIEITLSLICSLDLCSSLELASNEYGHDIASVLLTVRWYFTFFVRMRNEVQRCSRNFV